MTQIKGVYYHSWVWNMIFPRMTLNSEIYLPESFGIKGMYYLPCLNLRFLWSLSLKISSLSRSQSEACVFQPQDLDHRCDLHFWIVVHSGIGHIVNQE